MAVSGGMLRMETAGDGQIVDLTEQLATCVCETGEWTPDSRNDGRRRRREITVQLLS